MDRSTGQVLINYGSSVKFTYNNIIVHSVYNMVLINCIIRSVIGYNKINKQAFLHCVLETKIQYVFYLNKV